jgi:hypothetical protein
VPCRPDSIGSCLARARAVPGRAGPLPIYTCVLPRSPAAVKLASRTPELTNAKARDKYTGVHACRALTTALDKHNVGHAWNRDPNPRTAGTLVRTLHPVPVVNRAKVKGSPSPTEESVVVAGPETTGPRSLALSSELQPMMDERDALRQPGSLLLVVKMTTTASFGMIGRQGRPDTSRKSSASARACNATSR